MWVFRTLDGQDSEIPDFRSTTLEAKAIELGLATRETVATQFHGGMTGSVFRSWGRGYRLIATARWVDG